VRGCMIFLPRRAPHPCEVSLKSQTRDAKFTKLKGMKNQIKVPRMTWSRLTPHFPPRHRPIPRAWMSMPLSTFLSSKTMEFLHRRLRAMEYSCLSPRAKRYRMHSCQAASFGPHQAQRCRFYDLVVEFKILRRASRIL
jgi:hypothetical protein